MGYYDDEGAGPGYEGLILMGKTPQEAWAIVRYEMQQSGGLDVLRELAVSEAGRAALRASTLTWAERGLPPPWDGLIVL